LSRNFELLQQVGGILELPVSPEEAKEPVTMPPVETEPSTPALDVAGKVRDEIAKLVLNLFLLPAAQAQARRQVIFAGAEAGAGSSWMCARVAEVLASQVRGSVCVVDCNLRSPGLHRQFAVDNHFGLSDALLRSDPLQQYVRQLSRKNLWLLSCGSSTENWEEKVGSGSLRLRLAELRAQFDYVLMDVASTNTCNDGIVLGSSSDGIVLVLKANCTRRDVARKALQELKAANVPVLGAVLNQRTFPIPDNIYNSL
jgi:Mrp family chromosome partitioning ATPase